MHLSPSQGPEATRKGISLRGLTKLRARIMQLCEDGLFDKVCRVITSNLIDWWEMLHGGIKAAASWDDEM